MSNQQFLSGSFAPTTQVWDVSRLYEIEVTSPEFKELLVRLYQNLNLMSIVLNSKESGYFNTIQDSSGKLYFPNPTQGIPSLGSQNFRQGLRLVVNFGALPNSASKTVAHGITVTSSTVWVNMYASATDSIGLTGISFAYPMLSVNSANVTITATSDLSNYTICYVVLEYLQF